MKEGKQSKESFKMRVYQSLFESSSDEDENDHENDNEGEESDDSNTSK
jgi:hypothetical protein